MKPCGECTMCCKLIGVAELRKPAARWCEHCEIGSGCRVYDERPPTCREFQCLWTRDESMPDELRPDRCGVIWLLTKDRRVGIALTERSSSSHRRLREHLQHRGISVVAADPRRFPDGLNDIYPARGHAVEDVRQSLAGGLA